MKLQIREGEELVDALKRVLEREPTQDEWFRAIGGRFAGESIVRPKPYAGEIYDENSK